MMCGVEWNIGGRIVVVCDRNSGHTGPHAAHMVDIDPYSEKVIDATIFWDRKEMYGNTLVGFERKEMVNDGSEV